MADVQNQLTRPDQTAPAVRTQTQKPQQTTTEIDLVALFLRLLEKCWIIILAAIVGAGIMGVYSFFIAKPEYQATSKIYIVGSDSAISLSDLQIGTNLAADYQQVFKTWHVHELVDQRMGLDYSYSKLASMVSVSNPSNTHIIAITVTSTDPREAMDMANTYANVAREFIASRMDMREPTLFEQAKLPDKPVSPQKTKNILMGFLIGALIAAAIITVLFLSDDRIRTSEEVTRQTGLPSLGIVPLQDKKHKARDVAVVYGRPETGKEGK